MDEKAFTKKVLRILNQIENLHPIRIIPGAYGGMKGVSDILVCCDGKFGAIELKVGTNKPTKLQQRFLDNIISAGGFAFVCRTIEEVREAVERIKHD
jgi:hypothetical protein